MEQINYTIENFNSLLVQCENLQTHPISESEVADLIKNISKFSGEFFREESDSLLKGHYTQRVEKASKNIRTFLKTFKGKSTEKASRFSLKYFSAKRENPKNLNKLVSDLNKFDTILEDLKIHGMFVDHFINKSSSFFREGRAAVEFIFNSLRDAITSERILSSVFMGSSININKNETKLAKLNKKIEHLGDKIKKLEDEIAKHEKIPESERSSRVNQSLEKNKTNLTTLQDKIEQCEQKKEKVEETLKKIKITKEKAERSREQLNVIGGQRIKIKLPREDVTLDGMYVSCETFRQNLQKAGAQAYHLQATSKKNKKNIELNGIAFPKDASELDMMRTLNSLGAFGLGDKPGAGWTKVVFGDQILFIPDQEADQLTKKTTQKFDKANWDVALTLNPLDECPSDPGGTVLLGTGAGTTYEIHKKEILAYLLRGMNVMAVNPRGYGESTGTPSQHGMNRDMEAAYNYLKKNHKVPDDKILVKGVCMSGGPAAWLAGRHPRVNLFLDQTYADFGETIVAEAEKSDEFSKYVTSEEGGVNFANFWKKTRRAWNHMIIKLAAPAWKVSSEIGKVKGHVGLLLLTQDELMPMDRDITENFRALLKDKNRADKSPVSIMEVQGEHGTSWLELLPPQLVKISSIVDSIAKEVREKNPKIKDYFVYFPIGRKVEELIQGAPPELSQIKGFSNFIKDLIKDIKQLQESRKLLIPDVINDLLEKHLEKLPADKVSKKTKELVREFLKEKLLMKCDFFDEILSMIREDPIFSGSSTTAQDIDNLIHEMSQSVPEDIREVVKTFLGKVIHVRRELSDPDSLIKSRYYGRTQMDHFLERSKLMGSLVGIPEGQDISI